MKITKVTPYPFFAGPKNLMLCRVDTDEGVYGWGEAYQGKGGAAVHRGHGGLHDRPQPL